MSTGVVGFQGALGQLAGEASRVTGVLMRRASNLPTRDAMTLVTDAYPEIVDPYIAAAGEMTAQWYGETRSRVVELVQGALASPEPAVLPDRRQLAASARWALTGRDPVTALDGATTRHVYGQSRRTVFDNAARDNVRWVRHASSNACGFCRMLATRVLTIDREGAPGIYRSEGSANRSPHPRDIRGHDHCKCVAQIAYGYEPPDYVYDWLDDYDAVSRNDDGALRREWNIAYRMEQRALDREGVVRRPRGRPRTRPQPEPKPPPKAGRNTRRDADTGLFIGDQRLYKRSSARAAQIARSARDRVATAAQIVGRADQYAATAAKITGNVKKVTDVADKTIGGAVPVVRDIKVVVDAADRAATSAARLTGGAKTTVDLVDRTIKDTAQIAHGIKQVSDEVVSVIDDAVYVIAGAKALAAEATNLAKVTALGVREVDNFADLYTRAVAVVGEASRINDSALDLIGRARGAVATVQSIPADIADFPRVLRAPLADTRRLAGAASSNVDDLVDAADAAAALARAARAFVDQVAGYRRFGSMPDYDRRSAYAYSTRVVDEVAEVVSGAQTAITVRPPTWVFSERLDLPAPPTRLALPAGQQATAEAITDVVDNVPAPSRLALEAPPALKALPAAPKKTRKRRRNFADIENDFYAAVESGDDVLIAKLADEMEDAEKALQRSAARQAKKDKAKRDEIDRLIASGYSENDAYQEVYDISDEGMARQQFIYEARSNGHKGRGFDELLTSVFNEMILEEYLKCAEYCRGGGVTKKQYQLTVDPMTLWTSNEARARKVMSEEAAAWFDQNGRLTKKALRESILSGDGVWNRARSGGEDFLQ